MGLSAWGDLRVEAAAPSLLDVGRCTWVCQSSDPHCDPTGMEHADSGNCGQDATAFAIPVRFSVHAVQRYRERVKPTLTRHQAEQDLIRVAAFGRLLDRPPAWMQSPWHAGAPLYLEIADIVLTLRTRSPAIELVATTCMTKRSYRRRSRQGRLKRQNRRSKRRSRPMRRARQERGLAA